MSGQTIEEIVMFETRCIRIIESRAEIHVKLLSIFHQWTQFFIQSTGRFSTFHLKISTVAFAFIRPTSVFFHWKKQKDHQHDSRFLLSKIEQRHSLGDRRTHSFFFQHLCHSGLSSSFHHHRRMVRFDRSRQNRGQTFHRTIQISCSRTIAQFDSETERSQIEQRKKSTPRRDFGASYVTLNFIESIEEKSKIVFTDFIVIEERFYQRQCSRPSRIIAT